MLLSPGNSPRQISSPSPSLSETPTQKSTLNPNSSSRNQSQILDEDSYVAAIEKIIERDFFPDIPKLRDRLDWLQAVRTADPVVIRDAQLKILDRRAGKPPSSIPPTPNSTFLRSTTPFASDKTPIVTIDETELRQSDDVPFSLDEFFRRYTSEDNASFSRIIEKVNKKRKERYGYLLEGENEENDETSRKKSITDGYGTSDQPPSTLLGWKYTAKNLLMYHPADLGEAPLTEDEMHDRIKALTREVVKTNTRFHGKIVDDRGNEDEPAVMYANVVGGTPVPMSMADRYGDKQKKYDLEDLKRTPNKFYVESSKKADNGYNYVKTPSPMPGVDESPFITWGEIEGTPMRLESEDTPFDIGGSGNGPQFNIPLPPTRDLKAHSLSREAARKIRERSRMFQKPPLPSPVRGGSASPAARRLSPAAQKFVRNAMANSSRSANVDESLRASYRGSSPGIGTPKSGRSMSRLGRDSIMGSKSPSVREGSNPPW